MAEANVTGGGQPKRQRFFCYKCNGEIGHVQEDFSCPVCGCGFIEQMEEGSGGGNNTNPTTASSQQQQELPLGHGLDFLQLLRGLSEPGGGGQAHHTSVRFGPAPSSAAGGGGSNNPSFRRTRSEGSGGNTPNPHRAANFSFVFEPMPGGHGGGGRVGGSPDNPVENVLLTFLNDLITGLGGGPMVGGAGGVPVMTNFGDYAWGSDGFDAIVTQLMNQMEGTGPAPLAEDKLQNLPDVKIVQDHVDRKLQCSVCWDDFTVDEQVKQLECEHLYHPDCIIPWLKQHGTCPICRKNLNGEEANDPNTSPSSRFEPSVGSASSSSTTSPPNTNPSSAASSNTASGADSNRHGSDNQAFGPAAGLANILLNQFLPEAIGYSRGESQTGPRGNRSDNAQPGRDNDGALNPRFGPGGMGRGRGRGRGGRDPHLDSMDEFD